MLLRKNVSGTLTTLQTNTSASSNTGCWYNVYVRCDGQNVTVWRGTAEGGDPQTQVLSTSSAGVTTTGYLQFVVGSNSLFAVDNIRAASNSLSTTTAFAYNKGNELTKETVGAISKTYNYDWYGRRTTKAMQDAASQSLLALYKYGFDNKFASFTSNFPDV